MAYQFKPREPAGAGLLRIAGEQIDGALQALRDDGGDRHVRVHEVRKHVKKIRAVLRLMRPSLGAAYTAENDWYREASRRLAHVRDAGALVECLDRLVARFRDEVDVAPLAVLREALVARRDRLAGSGDDLVQLLDDLAVAMAAARARAACWPVPDDDFEALVPGFRKTYREGRLTFAAARLHPDAAHYHEWRKAVKAFWYQSRLLVPAWPAVLGAYVQALDDLAEDLGHLHDLDVLRQTIHAEPGLDARSRALPLLSWMLVRRREELRTATTAAGRRLYAERPRALVARLRGCWNAWQGEAAAHLARL